ncbi:ATP-binding protein [Massilia oculi]|uniref:histidine kinase n=1 Tax=Massilia oculi TaxID=945844 RepID=A0A2S2DG81_9BURK|nr:ATP-binding protein [Massilia oculi]AWL03886.1 hybrid sensor histidine kinase/response regulator [Massilia oculi]
MVHGEQSPIPDCADTAPPIFQVGEYWTVLFIVPVPTTVFTMHSSSFYEAVFNGSSVGTCLLSASDDPVILAVNDAFLRGNSRKREDLVGKKLFDVFPEDPSDPFDTGTAALRTALAKVVETGLSQVMTVQRYPIEVAQADGQIIFEERYWRATSTPILDVENNVVCIEHTAADVTDQVYAEIAKRNSEDRLSAFISATSDVIYRMSPDWKFMDSLDGRGFLKTTTQWAEWPMEQYVHPDDLERARSAIETAIREKSVFELEHRVLRVDGSCGWTYSRAAPRLDDNGEIFEWIGAASDITQRKLTEESLKQGERRKDEFLAMLAHELRNPLAPISSAAELLRLAPLDRPRVQQTSEIILRQIKHMASLVDDLMDVSRVSRGLVKLELAPLDVRQVVGEAVEQLTPIMQVKRHHLQFHLAPGTTLVSGDRKRLVQVVANLLNNAAKYTPSGGEIKVEAEARGTQVVVSVTDNGIGMQPDLVARVFDLFSQAEVTSDRTSGGLGLGLALVKNLVELHGGTVTAESQGLGYGSKFTVCLPHLEEAAGIAPAGGADQPHPSHNQKLRLLLVDDNVDGALTLAMLLEASGHTVTVEHHPRSALERAAAGVFDACLLDIGLPEVDGYELAKRLREHSGTAASVLIAVTGYGQEQDRQQSLEAGFAHHLVKPLDAAELFSIFAHIAPR